MKGKISKSTELKKLSGTFRADRVKAGMVGIALSRVPKAPNWLNDESKIIFKDICKMILSHKMLFDTDVYLIAVYSFEFWVFKTSVAKLQEPENLVMKTQSGYEQISPWITIRNQAQKNIRDIGAQFGLDPASRAKLGIKEPEQINDIQKLMMTYS
jgi:P27 family predicted phage terminase small subunit